MQSGERFTAFEGYAILAITFIFHIFDEVLPALTNQTGPAAWISQLVAAAFGAGLFYLYLLLFRRYSGKDLGDICSQVYGRALGKAVIAALLCYLLVFTVVNLHEVANILRVYTYPNTSHFYLKAAIVAAVAAVSIFSVKGLGKTVAICLPVCVASLVAILCLSAQEYDLDNLRPLLGYGLPQVFSSGFFLLSNYDGLLIVAVFLSYYGSAKDFHKPGLAALLTGIACCVITTFCYNLAFPYGTAAQSKSGVLDLAQGIYINRFFQRFESIFVAIMSTTVLLVLCLSFLAAKKVYCSLFGIPRKYAYAVSVSLALVVLCLSAFLGEYNSLQVVMRDMVRRYSIFFSLGLLLLTLLVSLLRQWLGKKGRPPRAAALLLVPCLLAGLFSGCGSYREPDEEVYAIVLGVDKGVTQDYKITLKFLQETDAGDTSSGEDGEALPGNVYVAEAGSTYKAVELMNAAITRHVSLTHVKMVVISEELAREGVEQILTPIAGHGEAKSNMAFVVCSGQAQDYVCNNEPQLGSSLPMDMEMLLQSKKGTGSYKVVTVAETLRNLASHYGDPMAIYAGLQEAGGDRESEPEAGAEQPGPGVMDAEKPALGQESAEPAPLPAPSADPGANHGGVPGYLPENVPVRGAAPYEYAGMAVFSGDKMVGALDTLETAVYMMLDGSYHSASFSMPDPDDPALDVIFEIRSRHPTRISTAVAPDGTPRVDITAYVGAGVLLAEHADADYASPQGIARLEDYAARYLEHQARQLILRTQGEWDADILLLGKRMAGNFRTIPQWEAYDWPARYGSAQINVQVEFSIAT